MSVKDDTPASVRGLKFRVDDRYCYMVQGGEIVLVDDHSYASVVVRMSFSQAKQYVAAVLALLEACGEAGDFPRVEVRNDELECAIKVAEMRLAEGERARAKLAEMVAAAKDKLILFSEGDSSRQV
jgi:hypothetical protein